MTIRFQNNSNDQIKKLQNYYIKAKAKQQNNIEAIYLSTIDLSLKKPFSRMVNVKYVENNELVFFSNYESKKAKEILTSNRVACIFFWNTINIQIRIEGTILKTSSQFSDVHFKNRNINKNILAISSQQSKPINSYEAVIEKYNLISEQKIDFFKRPQFWGGYSIQPDYFEFWHGNNNRLNKREEYKKVDGKWILSILEP